MVEGLRSQSVRPLRGLTGEARSRPGVTVAGGPTCTERYWSKLLHQSRAPCCPTSRAPHHGQCLLAGPVDAEEGAGVEIVLDRAVPNVAAGVGPCGDGNRLSNSVKKRQAMAGSGLEAAAVVGGSAVGGAGRCWLRFAAFRALLRLCGRCPCCAGRVLVSCPLLCKTGDMVQTVQPVVFRSCRSRTRWTCPLL